MTVIESIVQGFRAFILKKHGTLPKFSQSCSFRALKAQNAARLLGAAHPGLSLDLGSRGWGVTQDLLTFAFLAIFGVFSLASEHPKSRD